MFKKLFPSWKPKLQFIIFCMFGLVIISILVYAQIGFTSARTPAEYLVPHGERIFYLASGVQSADADLPLSVKELQEKEIVVVYEVDQLKQLIDANALDALIIHQSRADEIADLRVT